MKIAGSVAVVTGGASGLGAGAVRRLAAADATVAILDLPESQGKEVVEQIGSNCRFLECDVTDADAVRQTIASVVETYEKVDICVNAAGVPHSARVLSRDREPFPLDRYRRVIDVNLIGVFDVMRHAARAMSFNEPNEDGERGVVINVASTAAYEGVAGQAAYAASKGGVVAMTLPVARDLARWGIRVVTVCPGLFETAMFRGLPTDFQERLLQIPVFPRRPGHPNEFGMLAESIVTNPMLNGESIRLDASARADHNLTSLTTSPESS